VAIVALPEAAIEIADASAVVDLTAKAGARIAFAGAAVLVGATAAEARVNRHTRAVVVGTDVAAAIRRAAASGIDGIATDSLDSGVAREHDALAAVAAAVGLRGAQRARGSARTEILRTDVAAAVRVTDAARIDGQATETEAARVS
jgi:hypothetical protein